MRFRKSRIATAMLGGLLVTAAAFVPAYLSYRFIENPIRFSRPVARSNFLALSIGANFSLVGVVAGLALVLAVPSSSAGGGEDSPGAVALPGHTLPAVSLLCVPILAGEVHSALADAELARRAKN